MMADDILTERIPIMDGPSWGRIDRPGLGIEVDEDKLMIYHEAFLKNGEIYDVEIAPVIFDVVNGRATGFTAMFQGKPWIEAKRKN